MKARPNLDLVHFSDRPLVDIRSVAQHTAPFMKPQGLWLSVEGGDDSWSSWCVAERFALRSLGCAHEISLRASARILHLRSAAEIDAFTARYREPDDVVPGFYIRWWMVADVDMYQGIIIAPYCYARRLHPRTSWYYGWDCASGCIWNADAIERVTLIERPVLAEAAAS